MALAHSHGNLNTDSLCAVNFIFILYEIEPRIQIRSIRGGNQHRRRRRRKKTVQQLFLLFAAN